MTPSPFLLFVYSNKNIAGCALGLAALGAFFTGAIHDYWPEIVAGAYGIGFLATPGQPQVDPASFEAGMTADEVKAQLAGFVGRVGKLLPPDVLALVKSLESSIDAILPMLDDKSHGAGDQDAYTIRQTALHYLPETIEGYLKLPAAYRNLQPVADGKTAKTLLYEQLTVLDGKMKEIAANLTTNDAQALLANGRFLRERFAKESLFSVS
jgi:hypothetical protein